MSGTGREFDHVVVDDYNSGAIYAKLLHLTSEAADALSNSKVAAENVVRMKMCDVMSTDHPCGAIHGRDGRDLRKGCI